MYAKHRIIWMLVTGEDPGDLIVDHADRDKTNNAWHNLRLATESESSQNRGRSKDNSLPKGVYIYRDVFVSRIQVRGKRVYLGSFRTQQEAEQAYKEAQQIYHNHFSTN